VGEISVVIADVHSLAVGRKGPDSLISNVIGPLNTIAGDLLMCERKASSTGDHDF
jgi:hypothetical protein